MRSGQLGHIATPASGHRLQAGVHWCADNGAFTGVMWNLSCQAAQSMRAPIMVRIRLHVGDGHLERCWSCCSPPPTSRP